MGAKLQLSPAEGQSEGSLLELHGVDLQFSNHGKEVGFDNGEVVDEFACGSEENYVIAALQCGALRCPNRLHTECGISEFGESQAETACDRAVVGVVEFIPDGIRCFSGRFHGSLHSRMRADSIDELERTRVVRRQFGCDNRTEYANFDCCAAAQDSRPGQGHWRW